MAFELCCRITIDSIVLESVHLVDIVSTWKELSDRCTIKMPNRGFLNSSNKLKPFSFEQWLKVGMPVKVELGYNQQLVTEFEGYIAEIKPGFPFELRCEDQMWQLKREKVKDKNGKTAISYKRVKIADLLRDLMPAVIVDADSPKIEISNFLIENATKAKVLQELKEKYGLAIYFRGKQLYAGLPYFERLDELVIYDFQRNLVSSELIYRRAEDVKLKAEVISILSNNQRIKINDVGEVRTIHVYDVADKAELRKRAKSELSRYKYEGFRGSMTAFGQPFVAHTQVVELRDVKYPERNGRYLVDSVKTSFSASGGYRREIEVGPKVSRGVAADFVPQISSIDIQVTPPVITPPEIEI